MSTVTSGIEMFLSRPREADEYREFIRRLEKDHHETVNVIGERMKGFEQKMIAAQESEAVWKTERDKADQRRIEAENNQLRLEVFLKYIHVANRREAIAIGLMAGLFANHGYNSGPKTQDLVIWAIEGADALIAALEAEEEAR